jgi:hypothetical protein
VPLKFCVDNRIAGCPRYYLGNGEPLVFVPEAIRECVAFIGYDSMEKGGFKLAGTTFFIRMVLIEDFVVAHYAVIPL